jgi:hypothetical protein
MHPRIRDANHIAGWGRSFACILSLMKNAWQCISISLDQGIESIRKSFLDAKGRDVKLRYITEITTENISYCKELMKIADRKDMERWN